MTHFSWHQLRGLAACFLSAVVLLGCGGGGGGGGSSGGGGGSPGTTPVPVVTPSFPVLVTSPSFSLATIVDPAERTVLAGHQLGRVLLASGATAPAGLKVEWLDATAPATPRVLASAMTDAAGAFDIAGTSSLPAADQWLRVTLADGAVLRAFASGWTELSVGTEVALGEITRLRGAGALSARALPMAELAIGQQSLSLLGQARYAGPGAQAAINGLTAFVAQFLPWNQYLERLASAAPDAGPGDVAGILPFEAGEVTIAGTEINDGVTASVPIHFNCFVDSQPKWRECSYSATNRGELAEQLSVRPGAIFLHNIGGPDPLDQLIAQIGDLPLLEFAPAVGTRVIYNNAQIVKDGDPTIHAAIKVTRRTYPAAPVQAQGGSVTAIEVVLDYEVAILNTTTKTQADLLVRERRWFSPLGGRVRIVSEGLARTGATVTPASVSLTLDAGAFNIKPALPLVGAIDAVTMPLAHRHVVYSAALNRLYAASETGGGQILELDPATLATVRSVATTSVPTQLAVSADGSRLYVGLTGGMLLELRAADLGEVRRFPLGPAPAGELPFSIVLDMAVDPFDAERLLAVPASSRYAGSSPARVYSAGNLLASVSANYSADTVGWTSVRDEFLVAARNMPNSMYRFRVSAPAATELASLLRVNDVGVREVGGELLTPAGKILDAASLAQLRALVLPGFSLNSCMRLDARSALCELDGYSANGVDGTYVRFDNASGAFLGAFRPDAKAALAQCPINPLTQLWTAAGRARLAPMTDGRILVSNGDADQRCGIQLWSLRGYPN